MVKLGKYTNEQPFNTKQCLLHISAGCAFTGISDQHKMGGWKGVSRFKKVTHKSSSLQRQNGRAASDTAHRSQIWVAPFFQYVHLPCEVLAFKRLPAEQHLHKSKHACRRNMEIIIKNNPECESSIFMFVMCYREVTKNLRNHYCSSRLLSHRLTGISNIIH